MRRIGFLLAVTATLLCTGTVVEAIEPYLEFREELDLSDRQISDLESIVSSLRKAEIRAEANLRIAEVELDELLRAEKADLSKVKPKLEEIAKLQAELKFLHIKAEEDAKKILTEEQLRKFGTLKGPEWERGARIKRRIERDIEARRKELKERQREMLDRLEETMMRELKRRDRELKEILEKLGRKEEEIRGTLKKISTSLCAGGTEG